MQQLTIFYQLRDLIELCFNLVFSSYWSHSNYCRFLVEINYRKHYNFFPLLLHLQPVLPINKLQTPFISWNLVEVQFILFHLFRWGVKIFFYIQKNFLNPHRILSLYLYWIPILNIDMVDEGSFLVFLALGCVKCCFYRALISNLSLILLALLYISDQSTLLCIYQDMQQLCPDSRKKEDLWDITDHNT